MKDDLINIEELSLKLIGYLQRNYPGLLQKRYNIDESGETLQLLEAIARERNCVRKGADLDYEKAAAMVMEEFRGGRLGRITLE